MRLLVPPEIRRHQPGGPHQPQPGPERSRDPHGQDALNVEQHDDAGLVHWGKDNLADRERRVRISENGRLGTRIDAHFYFGTRDLPRDLQRVASEPKRELEVIEDFQRVDPRFERAALVPEDGSFAPHHVEERTRLSSPLELQSVFLEGEFRHDCGRRLGSCDGRGDKG